MTSQIIEESYHATTCYKCGVKFWLPTAIHETALIRCDEFTFWCPNGHGQHFVRQEEEDDPDPGEEVPDEQEAEIVRFPIVVGGRS